MLKPGSKIKMRTKSDKKYIITKWTVIKVYPFHVLCKNQFGTRSCFSYGDLIVNKIIRQPMRYEQLRYFD